MGGDGAELWRAAGAEGEGALAVDKFLNHCTEGPASAGFFFMLERSQKFRWMRPNAHLYIREDAHRFMTPGAPRHIGRDAVKYFEPRDLHAEFRERKYSPNQPRVPAGNPGGGQWTSRLGAAGGHSEGGALGGDQIALGEGGEGGEIVRRALASVDGRPLRASPAPMVC